VPRSLAILLFTGFIVTLFARDRTGWRGCSAALWIPQLWIIVVASRPLSNWLTPVIPQGDFDIIEGSPLDRAFFLTLSLAGLVVVLNRTGRLTGVLASNKWLLIAYSYFAVSTLWSDYPFVSFKRWYKDCGNVIMVLVLMSERSPVLAIRTVLLRSAYLLLPLSALFIKYVPELGRTYNRWTWMPQNVGVCTNKNELGALALISSLVLFWHLLLLRRDTERFTAMRWDIALQVALACVVLYVFVAAGCVTALVCAMFGAGTLVLLSTQDYKGDFRRYERLILGGVGLWVVLDELFDVEGTLFGFLGRDPTLTGRTEIWKLALSAKVDPVLGAGFYTFWLGDRSASIREIGYSWLNQAHNGYIETYLNTGVVGLGLLMIALLTAYANGRRRLVAGGTDADRIQIVLLLVLIVYNFTEAAFNRMGIIWFAGLWAMISANAASQNVQQIETTEELSTAQAACARELLRK